MSNKKQIELIKKAQNGDISAFERLIENYKDKAYQFSLSICCGDQTLAGDLLQNGLLKAFIHIKKFKAKSAFSTWLWRIIKNEFLDYKKSPKNRDKDSIDEVYDLSTTENIEELYILRERQINLLKLIDKLPKKYEEMILLVDIQEFSYQEVADQLSIPLDRVRVQVYRAREKLTKLVKKNRYLFE